MGEELWNAAPPRLIGGDELSSAVLVDEAVEESDSGEFTSTEFDSTLKQLLMARRAIEKPSRYLMRRDDPVVIL